MSKRVAQIKKAIAAYNDGDFEAALRGTSSDIEFKRSGISPEASEVLRGRDQIAEFFAPDTLEQRFEPIEFIEGDDKVFCRARAHSRGVASGVEVEQDTYIVYSFGDDRIKRMEFFFDRDEAERAAGLDATTPDDR